MLVYWFCLLLGFPLVLNHKYFPSMFIRFCGEDCIFHIPRTYCNTSRTRCQLQDAYKLQTFSSSHLHNLYIYRSFIVDKILKVKNWIWSYKKACYSVIVLHQIQESRLHIMYTIIKTLLKNMKNKRFSNARSTQTTSLELEVQLRLLEILARCSLS